MRLPGPNHRRRHHPLGGETAPTMSTGLLVAVPAQVRADLAGYLFGEAACRVEEVLHSCKGERAGRTVELAGGLAHVSGPCELTGCQVQRALDVERERGSVRGERDVAGESNPGGGGAGDLEGGLGRALQESSATDLGGGPDQARGVTALGGSTAARAR